MIAPRLGISVRIDPGLYLSVLSQGVARHLGDLRVALRSLEDGSFSTKASAPRPGALLQFTFAPTAQLDTAAVRLCNRCFVNIVWAHRVYDPTPHRTRGSARSAGIQAGR